MELKLKDVLNEHLGILLKMRFKASLAFRLTKLRNEIDPHVKAYNEVHNSVLEKHGIEPGMLIKDIPKDKLAAANKELEELLEQTLTVKDIGLSLDDLGNNEVSPETLDALSWLIKEPEIVTSAEGK